MTNPAAVAVVALDRRPVALSPDLSVIQALRAAGVMIVVCADDSSAWEIRSRCLLYLAGASHLFDTRQPQFAEELTRALRNTHSAITRRQDEEREVISAMQQVGIVAGSKTMFTVFRSVLRFSRLSDLPVLISGETGTGKELVARALHELDPKRSRGPFVPVNCGALSSTLAESELFGSRRGSFTGADRDRRGLIRAAHGGVLFLDEVGELPEVVQTKLLRVLQEGRVLALGEEREEPVDVRVVAATNRNLMERVGQGAFRADLLHRLNVLAIQIPPLRERRPDIRLLVEHFLEKHAGPMGCQRPRLTDEVSEALEQLELPGNVRQLENIVRQALVRYVPPASLCLADLPPEVWSEVSAGAGGSRYAAPADGGEGCPDLETEFRRQLDRLNDLTECRLSRSLEFCERVLVSLALERTGGNQSQTARLLGITPRSVYNKVHKYRLD